MSWLERWWLRPAHARAGDSARWVVLDVESSGLNPQQDRLLAIAAVAVHTGGDKPVISLADSFEVVIRQPAASAGPDRQNILLHGIGIGAQSAGLERGAALNALTRFVADSGLVAFHVAFDPLLSG